MSCMRVSLSVYAYCVCMCGSRMVCMYVDYVVCVCMNVMLRDMCNFERCMYGMTCLNVMIWTYVCYVCICVC